MRRALRFLRRRTRPRLAMLPHRPLALVALPLRTCGVLARMLVASSTLAARAAWFLFGRLLATVMLPLRVLGLAY